MVFIVPTYLKMKSDGLLDARRPDVQGFTDRADACLMALVRIANHLVNYWFLWVFLLVVVWGLFEWRSCSENKSFMRLSGLGLVALTATIGVVLMTVSLIVPYAVALPTLYTRPPEPIVQEDRATIETAMGELERAVAKKDWKESDKHLSDVWKAINDLAVRGAAAAGVLSIPQQPKIDQLRVRLGSASDCMIEIQNAILAKESNP